MQFRVMLGFQGGMLDSTEQEVTWIRETLNIIEVKYG